VHIAPNANGIYSFHASTAAYSEFWTSSFGEAHSVKVPRRQMWQAFIQESVRSISDELKITFESASYLPIADLTPKAYDTLGENGEIRPSDGHACLECTQDYKATADYIAQNDDPAALLGIDGDGPVPALADPPLPDMNPGNANVPNQEPNASSATSNSPVKMIVMDGIVMGPLHCAAIIALQNF
jgi:hypothetical protein